MVPVQVGHEDVEGLRRRAPRRAIAAWPNGRSAAAQVAEHVVGAAGLDLDARGVAAVGAGGRERQAVDVALDVGVGGEAAAATRRAARRRSLCRTPAAVSATGSEPRVPQKRTRFMAAPAAPALPRRRARPASTAPARRARRRAPSSTRSKRLIAKISRHDRLQRGDREPRLRVAHLLGGDHQHAQADAADVVDPGKVEHQGALGGRRGGHQRRQRRLELRSASMVDAAHGHGNDGVGDVARCDLQVHPSSRRPVDPPAGRPKSV